MRLDHLLSREEEVGVGLLFRCRGEGIEGKKEKKEEEKAKKSGGDAFRGNTRTHPEHES